MTHKILLAAVALAAGLGIGYYVGYDVGYEKAIIGGGSINSFEECAAAGYPIMESYPEQCRTPDGRTFWYGISVGPVPAVSYPSTPPSAGGGTGGSGGTGGYACTMEAKICPDGSAVGRTGPNCEFSPCP